MLGGEGEQLLDVGFGKEGPGEVEFFDGVGWGELVLPVIGGDKEQRVGFEDTGGFSEKSGQIDTMLDDGETDRQVKMFVGVRRFC